MFGDVFVQDPHLSDGGRGISSPLWKGKSKISEIERGGKGNRCRRVDIRIPSSDGVVHE